MFVLAYYCIHLLIVCFCVCVCVCVCVSICIVVMVPACFTNSECNGTETLLIGWILGIRTLGYIVAEVVVSILSITQRQH